VPRDWKAEKDDKKNKRSWRVKKRRKRKRKRGWQKMTKNERSMSGEEYFLKEK
jgi:hypothetical protein